MGRYSCKDFTVAAEIHRRALTKEETIVMKDRGFEALLLTTDKYDIIRSWSVTKASIKKLDLEYEDSIFNISIENWPQVRFPGKAQ
jgi:hypothetical protein